MCGIIGSFDSAVVLDGVEACKSRGDEAASLTVIDTSGEITSIYKRVYPGSSTKVKTWLSDVPTGSYMLVHLQAPTNTSTPGISRVHPASEGADLLWHNGIIKNVVGWDTKCLLHKIRPCFWKLRLRLESRLSLVYLQKQLVSSVFGSKTKHMLSEAHRATGTD